MSVIKNRDFVSYTVEEDIELLPFLLKVINKSRNSVKSILKRRQVMVDGQVTTQHNYQLSTGQEVDVLTNKAALKYSRLDGVSILYEDDSIIVINKDAGVLSMSSNNPNERNAYRQLTDFVKHDHRGNRVLIVHRLDRDTSGVMVFAKTEEVKDKLQKNWDKVVKKRIYTALVEGEVEKESDTIISYLKETSAYQVYSTQDKKDGKRAVTHYRKIAGNDQFSLLEVELETGRKNQIRVHMQDIGHPIVGDKKYGAHGNPIRRVGLHASTLEFIHPKTDKLMNFTKKAPRAFYRIVK